MALIETFRGKLSKISQSSPHWKTNPWVLGWLALLSCVLLVNSFMIFKAITTNPGLVVKDYYDQGRAHERDVLQKIAAHNALKWDIHPTSIDPFVINTSMPYGIEIKNVQNLPLEKAKVNLLAYRPADAKADFSVPLLEISPGHYQGDIRLPLKGVWDLIVNIERGTDSNDFIQRINVLAQ